MAYVTMVSGKLESAAYVAHSLDLSIRGGYGLGPSCSQSLASTELSVRQPH